jgi:orotate phosphoribosyltransferase
MAKVNNGFSVLFHCEELGAILRDGHFLLKSGRHSSMYLAKDALQPHTLLTKEMCHWLFQRLETRPHFVIAPAVAGISLAQMLAHTYSELLGRQVYFVYTEKHVGNGIETQRIKRPSFVQHIKGHTGIVFEDVLTTGASTKSVVDEVRAIGGQITHGAALFNRGGVRPLDIGLTRLESLVTQMHLSERYGNDGFKTYEPGRDTCPMCAEDMPLNLQYGHAAAELARQQREQESKIPPLDE